MTLIFTFIDAVHGGVILGKVKNYGQIRWHSQSKKKKQTFNQDQEDRVLKSILQLTRRCFDRSSDSIAMFKSVFLLISAMAVSNARWRKFARPLKVQVRDRLGMLWSKRLLFQFQRLQEIRLGFFLITELQVEDADIMEHAERLGMFCAISLLSYR